MAYEMTHQEYCDKHSVFTATELIEYRNRERVLVCTSPEEAIKFWQDKQELFRKRIADRLLAAGSEA